jgi:predicted acetylornithine/succinylornithine family transaminase
MGNEDRSEPYGYCPIMPTYGAPAVMFVEGEGSWLVDREGKRYLDFLAGIAVTSLGHAHPAVAQAVADQARTLVHTSNLFATPHAAAVAAQLDSLIGGGGQVFFSNSGAEANECAIKLARKFGGRGRHVVVSALGSFHGRTLATLHATGQPTKHEVFQPLPEGFRHVPFGEVAELESALDPTVAAVLIETVQGEGGVNPASTQYLSEIRRLCTERGVLMMVDEVQTGLGRTGRWFGFQHAELLPDVVTMAKALGNGVPIGACWARREVAAVFEPGDHATTYGGNALVTAAARCVLEVMEAEDVCGRAERAGMRLREALTRIDGVDSVRGQGLLLAVELEAADAKSVAGRLLEDGMIVNAVSPSALRLTPSLLITEAEIDIGVEMIAAAIEAGGNADAG